MDLKNFKVLDKTQYDALSERDQVKYELQLEEYKKQEMDNKIKETIDQMKAELVKELNEGHESKLKDLSEANEKALKDLAEKYETDIETFKAQLARAKVGEVGERMKSMSDRIIEKLSTEEGEKMITEFIKGNKEALAVDLDQEAIKAMAYPAAGIAPQIGSIVGPGHDEFHARNVIPVLPTTSNLYKFIQYVLDDAEPGFGMVDVGGQKPTINYTPSVAEAPVRKIAGLLHVPDEVMDDVVGFRAWIAYELPKAYMDAEDLQIFKGDGTGLNLLGLWFQANPQSLPLGSVTPASNTIDKIIAGITEIRLRKRATSGVFVSPVEWMEILINKGNTDEYTYPIILDANGVMRIGGVPIFWSNVFEPGEGLVGDFARGTAIMQKMAMRIDYSSENKDNFEKNIVTIRLEGRLALPIFYPEAFLKLFNETT